MKKISICVPCYNESGNIHEMYFAIKKQMELKDNYDYEIIFADNASTDNSEEILRNIALQDKKVKVILNATNFGVDRSYVNILKRASGNCCIIIPCDFQEPPEMLARFIDEWEQGYEVVWGQKDSSEESKGKYFCRTIFYKILKTFTDNKEIEQITGFGLIDEKVLKTIMATLLQDPHYSYASLVLEYGYRVKLISYRQRNRKYGKSSYNIKTYFDYALISLCNTSLKPLRLITITGIVMGGISLLVSIVYFVYKLLNWNQFNVGIAPAVIGLFFLGSVELFCLGIIGEYIGIVMRRITNKEVVVEKEIINF